MADSSICFRHFEERDVDFIFAAKNNPKLWKDTFSGYKSFSHEDAEKWVLGCMNDNHSYKFWAIAKNTPAKEIIGWASISNIDYDSKSADINGMVIADSRYHDGFTSLETIKFIFEYVFSVLQFDTLSTQFFDNHPVSQYLAYLPGLVVKKEEHVLFNGTFRNVISISLSRSVYLSYKDNNILDPLMIGKLILDVRNGKKDF